LARCCKSSGGLGRCSNYGGSIFPGTRSRRSLKNRTQVYVDAYNIGAVFHRSFFESARSNVVNRDLDVGLQLNRARLCAICRSPSGRRRIHDFISDRLDSGRCAIADALALAANRFARGLDFHQRRVQQNRTPAGNRPAVAWEKSSRWNCSARSRVLDVANNARLVAICRCSQGLAFLAESPRCFIRRPARFAPVRSIWANTFAASAKRRFHELCRRFARNVPNRLTAQSQRRFLARIAPIALFTSMPPSRLTAVVALFATSFLILNTAAKSISAIWSRAGWSPRSTTSDSANDVSTQSFPFRFIRRDSASAVLIKLRCWPNGWGRTCPFRCARRCNASIIRLRKPHLTAPNVCKTCVVHSVYEKRQTCETYGCF